jgi:hypothetical protein
MKKGKTKLSNNEIIQILDYTMNELYLYFEKDLNPRLKYDSFEDDLKRDKKKQSDLLRWFDGVRESIENK